MPSSYAAIRRIPSLMSRSHTFVGTGAVTPASAADLSRKNLAKRASYLTGASQNPANSPNSSITVLVNSKVGRTGGSIRSKTFSFGSIMGLSPAISFSTKCGPLRIAATKERNLQISQRLWQEQIQQNSKGQVSPGNGTTANQTQNTQPPMSKHVSYVITKYLG